MNIELNQTEVETITEALEAWERDCSTSSMIGGLLGAMVMGDRKDADYERKVADREARSEAEGRARKIKSTLLQAKLMQAAMASVTG